jgi:GWxTD domain-containing protein
MRAPFLRSAFILAVVLTAPGLASAQKLDKEDKKFLESVRPIITQEEEKTFKSLKDRNDRLEFQKIFWARRDPDLATPENEFEAQFHKDAAEADKTFRVPARAGSMTDCGRAFILLGKPDEVRAEDTGAGAGERRPETWTYRDRPGQTYQGGKAVIAFDQECQGTAALGAQFDRIAAAKVVRPDINFRTDKDGRVVKLADQLPKDTAARVLMKQPKQEFPLATQLSYMKAADGSTAMLGLVRGDAAGLAVSESGGQKVVNVSVAASAARADGVEAGWYEQTMNAPVGPDGAFVGSFKLGLKPGSYTLKTGAVDTKGGKAALATATIEVPDFAKVEAAADGTTKPVPSAAPLFLVREIQDLPPNAPADPAHPYGAFQLGNWRLVPFFGTTFKKTDQISIVYQTYDLGASSVTGKADAVATISILKDGKTPVAKAANPVETAAVGGSVIGPVPLATYEAGKYVVQLKVKDAISNKEIVQETPFEVVP